MNRSKPKLLVILGAGSSIPCGMPSVAKLDELMRDWSREWVPEPPVNSKGNVFNVLWEAFERYYETNHYGICPNYERVLGKMTELATWLSPPPFGNPMVEAIIDGALIDSLEWLRRLSGEDKYAARKLILNQQTFLLEKLANHMRSLSKKIDSQSPQFSNYTKFFCKLRNAFELGVYNLNYDTVANTSWPEAYHGFDSCGNFDAPGITHRQKWDFIYHLHGSVHHCISNAGNRIIWRKNLGEEFRDSDILVPDMAREFRSIPLTTVIAGGFKSDQLLREPYQTFYSTLVRHAHECDAILIVGYGFGDSHVNRVIQNRFEVTDDESPHPRVVILEKSSPTKPQTASIQSHNFWAYQLTHTLNTRFRITKAHINHELTVSPFIKSGEFETDILNRVAVWHGGFCDAISAFDKISKQLSRRL